MTRAEQAAEAASQVLGSAFVELRRNGSSWVVLSHQNPSDAELDALARHAHGFGRRQFVVKRLIGQCDNGWPERDSECAKWCATVTPKLDGSVQIVSIDHD